VDTDSKYEQDLNFERSSLIEYEKDEEDKFDGIELEDHSDHYSFRIIEEDKDNIQVVN
jgi:hypothetical protein